MQKKVLGIICLLVVLVFSNLALAADGKVVIAHRGASGYLPELTLESLVMAYALGADLIEIDLLLTKDGVPIALHDLQLENTTNVREVFPSKARSDGSWYAIDFSLSEVRELQVNERVAKGSHSAQYPARFPVGKSSFQVPTFAEIIELIEGLNKSTGRNVGILVELKSAVLHRQMGSDLEKAVLDVLDAYGYNSADSSIYLQSFESDSLKRLRFELKTELPLYQLISASASYNSMVTPKGLDEIATYAQGIAPAVGRLVDTSGRAARGKTLVEEAHLRGLKVVPYTLRKDQLPRYAATLEEQIEQLLFEVGVDGVIIDHPDIAVEMLRSRNTK